MNLLPHMVLLRRFLIGACAIAAICFLADAKSSPANVRTGDATIYSIRMTTSLQIPAETRTDRLRVYHALPPRRPWSMFTGQVGATKIQFSSGGDQDYDSTNNSHHILWEPPNGLTPGEVHRFLSQFEVRSVNRSFNHNSANLTWSAYDSLPALVRATSESKPEKIPDELSVVAEQIRQKAEPAQAILLLGGWTKTNVRFDPLAKYATENAIAIMMDKKGNAAHREYIFRLLCASVGIPIRSIWGLNLQEPEGRGELHTIRPDLTNVHIWNEVYFPGSGWVEVDVLGEGNPYVVPARLVKNNDWFPNYRVRVRVDREDRAPDWTQDEGKFVSEFGIEHVIEFRSREG